MAKARIDATAHRLARMAFMAKYAHAMPIAKNTAAAVENIVSTICALQLSLALQTKPILFNRILRSGGILARCTITH